MNKQQLIEYLNAKYEALDFWNSLNGVLHFDKKIELLNTEIAEAKRKLERIRQKESFKKVAV